MKINKRTVVYILIAPFPIFVIAMLGTFLATFVFHVGIPGDLLAFVCVSGILFVVTGVSFLAGVFAYMDLDWSP